jgi:peptidoglycan DL-endopeptidase CwlO
VSRPALAAALALALLLCGCAGIAPRPERPDAEADAGPPPAADLDGEAADADGDALEGNDVAEEPDGGGEEDGAATLEPADDPLGAVRARILAAARRRLGTRPALDCSGFVLDAYRKAGVAVRLGRGRSRSESLHGASRPVDRPRPGDLAFFHDTYDRNRDGRGGDLFTHVALVEAVDGDVVTLLHRGRKVERLRMDLARPSDPETNDILRVKRRRDAPGTRYLAGELFTAFGELLEGALTPTLQGGHAEVTRGVHPATR